MSLPQTYTALIANGKGKEPTLEQFPLPTPGKNQLLVEIAFAPINPADILNISEDYPLPVRPPNPVGLEGSGTVVAIGEDLKVPHQIGDRVHVRALGTYGQYVLADSESLRKIQDGLSFEEAASHFINPATIVSMGDYAIKNGHKAVIHTAGSSALGRMLIRYLKHKGIKTINIVRRDDFTEELKKEGADYVLNSQAPDFETQLKEIAHREEATLALDAVAGDMTAKLLKNQPRKSEVSIYGILAGGDLSTLKAHDFLFDGKRVTGFHVGRYLEDAQQTGEDKRLLDEAYALLPTVLNSKIQKVFKLQDIKEALALHQTHGSQGKILIKPN